MIFRPCGGLRYWRLAPLHGSPQPPLTSAGRQSSGPCPPTSLSNSTVRQLREEIPADRVVVSSDYWWILADRDTVYDITFGNPEIDTVDFVIASGNGSGEPGAAPGRPQFEIPRQRISGLVRPLQHRPPIALGHSAVPQCLWIWSLRPEEETPISAAPPTRSPGVCVRDAKHTPAPDNLASCAETHTQDGPASHTDSCLRRKS